MEFDWDAANIDHIARHSVEPDEVEAAFADPRRMAEEAYSVPGERRRAVIGVTDAGRLLYVVYTMRRGAIRTVTARNANARQRRRYGRRGS